MARPKKSDNQELTTASVLAFSRSIKPSDGLLYETTWDERNTKLEKLPIKQKTIRGTISNRLKNVENLDPAKLNAEVEKANIQTIDFCSLSSNCDTLVSIFTVRFLNNILAPCVCNKQEYQSEIVAKVKDYSDNIGFNELSKRYVINIANGRHMWRNRMESDKQETIVEVIKNGIVDKTFTFDSSDFDLSNFEVDNKDLEELANMICEAFTESGLLLNVKSFCYMGNGQDVFPSEEFIQDKAKAKKGDKSKQLFSLDGQAALHSQKIGNAIRTIDTWYSEYDERLVPISAECYGAVTTLGRAFRSKENFYTLLDGWILKDNELTDEQKHFVISILIRGGVFGESSKE